MSALAQIRTCIIVSTRSCAHGKWSLRLADCLFSQGDFWPAETHRDPSSDKPPHELAGVTIIIRQVISKLDAVWPLEPLEPARADETARRFRYRDGAGEIGVIASVTQPFCGDCTRARLSAEGKLFTCLFAVRGHDLRALIRGGASDEELEAAVRQVWGGRNDRYSDLRSAATKDLQKVEMSYIGG